MPTFPYLDATLFPLERANDLLSRMTIEEKVKQLQCALKPPETSPGGLFTST